MQPHPPSQSSMRALAARPPSAASLRHQSQGRPSSPVRVMHDMSSRSLHTVSSASVLPEGLQSSSSDTYRAAAATVQLPSDVPTYLAVLKSDIFKLQMKLEKQYRDWERGRPSSAAGGRPSSARGSVSGGSVQSRRRSEIEAIRRSTEELDAVLAAVKGSEQQKVALWEHLQTLMVSVQMQALSLSDAAADLPVSSWEKAQETGTTVSSLVAVVDRLHELTSLAQSLQQQLRHSQEQLEQQAQASQGVSARSSFASSPAIASADFSSLRQALHEASDQLRILEGDLGVQSRHRHLDDERHDGESGAIQVLAERVVSFSARLEAVQASVEGLQKQLKSAHAEGEEARVERRQETVRAAAELARLTEANGDLAQRLHQAEEAAIAIKQRSIEEIAALTHRATQADQQAQSAAATFAQEGAAARARIGELEQLLQEETELRNRDAEAHCQDLDSTHNQYEADAKEHRLQLAEKDAVLARCKAELAELNRQLVGCLGESEEAQRAYEDNVRKLQLQNDLIRSELDAAVSCSAHLQKQLEGQAGDDVNEKQKELAAQLDKIHRTGSALESYNSEIQEKLQRENALLKQELRALRGEIQQQAKTHEDIESVYRTKLQQLTDGLGSGSATPFEEVLRDEMKVMQAVFEIKLQNLKEELAKTHHDQAVQLRALREHH